jgi:hypothetical protein
MKLSELTYSEMLEINGGSEASDSFYFSVGFVLSGMWHMVGSGGGGYAYAKCGIRYQY